MQFPSSVEQWRATVAKYFPPELVDKALYVIQHESGGDANARGDNGVAIGLFQIQDNNNFPNRPDAAFLSDPENNIKYAATQLGAAAGNWAPWGEGVTHQGQPFGALGNNPFPGSTGGSTKVEGLPEGAQLIGTNLARWLDPETGEYVYFRNNPQPFLDPVSGTIVPAGWTPTGSLPQPNAAKQPPKDIVYKGEKAYHEAPNGTLTRAPEFDIEPEKNARPLAASASQAIAGASAAAQKKATQQGASSSGSAPMSSGGAMTQAAQAMRGQFGLPNVSGADITAPQSSGVVPGDLIGELPSFLLGNNNPLGQPSYPIVSEANPSEGPGQGFGFTQIPGTEMAGGGTGVQFGGQLGDVGVGMGQFAPAILGSAGYKPTGDPMQDMMQALALQAQRQKIIDDPNTAQIQANMGPHITREGAAQTVIDKILGAQGVNYGQAGTYRDPNTGQLKDSHGMTIMETATASNVDPRTGVTGKVKLTPNLAGEGVFPEADFPSPVERYEDEFAAGGYRGVTTQPTRFHTSETGQPEMVTVEPLDEWQGLQPVTQAGIQGQPDPSGRPYNGVVPVHRNPKEEIEDANRRSFQEWMRQKAMSESIYLQGAANSRAQAMAQRAAGMWPEGGSGASRIGQRADPIMGAVRPSLSQTASMILSQARGRGDKRRQYSPTAVGMSMTDVARGWMG